MGGNLKGEGREDGGEGGGGGVGEGGGEGGVCVVRILTNYRYICDDYYGGKSDDLRAVAKKVKPTCLIGLCGMAVNCCVVWCGEVHCVM